MGPWRRYGVLFGTIGLLYSGCYAGMLFSLPTLTLTNLPTSPSDGATGVGIGDSIEVVFSEDMDPATISTETVTLADSNGNPVDISVLYSSRQLTITPLTNLGCQTTYTLTVRTGVRTLSGLSLIADWTITFTTEACPTAASLTIPDITPHDFGALSVGTSGDLSFTVGNSGGVVATSLSGGDFSAADPYNF